MLAVGRVSWPVISCVISLLIFALPSLAWSDDAKSTAVEELLVAATVNDEPVYLSEVQRELATALGTRKIDESALPYFQAKTLSQLIDRRLIIVWLKKQHRGASETEIELEVTRLIKRLSTREITLAQHLASLKMTELEMRRLIEWQITWRKFLARYKTDDNLKKYFNDHRRDFDGTRMRVAHILLRTEGGDIERVTKRSAELRESITNGSISFEEAAKQHSAAPTANNGGDIGFIERNKPMHEAFSRAAFALNAGETSPPVATPFGIHLIRCLEIEPGQLTWQDKQEELTIAVTRYLFDWAANQERENAAIRFTGASPHLDPGTEELVE